jgi:hypothetical protein
VLRRTLVDKAGVSQRSVHRTTALSVALLLAGFGALGVLVVRIASFSKCWRWAITEGREGPGLYALWRLLHEHPLYEAPLREPYSLTLYNFGFYHAYASVLRLFGVDGEALLSAPRALTLLGAAVGALVFVRIGARLGRPRDGFEWATLGALAFMVWFGTQFVSWWAFAVRPDAWAAAFALLGLERVLFASGAQSSKGLLAASLWFAIAWSFKQSTVWTFAGAVVAFTWLERDWKRSAALVAPFAAIVSLALVLGGPVYRENLLSAPALSRWHWALFSSVAQRAIPQNIWIFAYFLGVLAWSAHAGVRRAWGELGKPRQALILVALVACAFGSIAFGREGSNKNHLLEGYVACALASWAAWRGLPATAPWYLGVGGAVLALPLVLLPALQLAAPLGLVPDHRFGRTLFCRDSDVPEFARLAELAAQLPHPLYVDDEVFGQPWHATDNRYPTLVLDGTWYSIAKRERLLPPDFPREVLEKRGIRSAVLPEGHGLVDVYAARGVRCETLGAQPFGLKFFVCHLRP